ncbi:MAG: glutamate 5-kinase [SAR324 cluster bacterium]|nr:glutamate 5-kinase [SAR324 cluster bacterium]
MEKKIVIKVGTHVLGRENGRLNYNRISDLVDQIIKLRESYQVILVSSGATRAGKEFCQFENEKDPLIKKQMLASIGQGRLFQVYSDFFREHSVVTAQALLTSSNFRSKGSFQNMKCTLEGLLENRIMPIINENDVTSHKETSFGDNDQLAALTSVMLNVDLLVLVSDIVGFYTADPKKDSNAKLIPQVDRITPELLTLCENSLSDGGTGGMLSKLRAAELATQHGIPTIVCSGKEPDCLLKAGRLESSGTYFSPVNTKKQLSLRGSWMTSSANVKGIISIDVGAENALKANKSLLAVGVTGVEGKFNERDVVLIQNKEGIRIGTGLTNHPHNVIKKMIKGKDKPKGVVVIHKNHLYTL